MSSFRKFTAALAALAVTMTSVMTFSVAVAATTFTDASSIASWASSSVSALADSGVLSGRPDGSFDPQGQLNRAEIAKIAVKGAGLTEDTTGAPHFNDVAAADWFYAFVETLYNNGVVGGINGGALDSNGLATYNPAGTLNRAEGSKILVDAFDLETSYAGTPPNFPDVPSSAWFYDYVETAYAHGILNGYDNGNFGPADAITREQVAVIAQSSIEEAADGSKRRSDYTAGSASSATPETPTTPTPVTSEGTLNVAISASTPAAQTFPEGVSSTAVAAYDFTASSDDVVISNLNITRTGVGTDSDWSALYLYDGKSRLTSGKTVNSTTHQATFTGINVKVVAGTTKTIIVKADTVTIATGGDNFFEISASTDVVTNAKSTTGTFPAKSNKQEINANVTAGSILVEKSGSIVNSKVGEDDVTIGKFKLTTANEAGMFEEIALLVDGSISAGDVQNARLYQGSTLIASTDGVNSKDLLVFTLDTPFEIKKGDSRIFEVKADLNTGRGSDTVKIYVDEATDVVAIGGTYGFGMSVDISTSGSYNGTGCTAATGSCSYSVVQGGEITISSSGPSAADIAVNGEEISLLDFNINTLSEITIKKFSILLTTNDADGALDQGGLLGGTAGTTANYTDIKIINKDTGAVLMGPIDANVLTIAAESTAITATTDGDGYYVFADEFTMAAGESLDLRLTTDVANNVNANFTDDTIYATIDIVDGSYPEIKDVNNKTVDVGDNVVPTADITGKTMTITSPSLTVTKSSTPVSDTSVKGTNDVSLLGLTVAAGNAGDIKITQMVIRIRAEDDTTFNDDNVAASDIINNIELWVGDTKIAGPKGLSAPATIATGYYSATFDNISYTVSGGSTIQVMVKGDLSTNVAADRYIGADIDPDDDITCEDEDGNSVTAGGTAALNAAATQSPMLTVSTGGSLTISVDANTTKENIAVAGTADVETGKFKFTTTDEAFTVSKISVNNRQSAATAIGDYDNNIISVKLSYPNSSGATETKTGYLTSGTANFSGMDFYIAKDDDAVLTVSATLNTVSGGATAGEYIDLNLAFNDFEAVAQGSGETYKGSKVDDGVAPASDLDFGSTITVADAGVDVAVASAVVLNSSATITVNLGAETLPIGTLIAFTAAPDVYAEDTDILLVLTTAVAAGAATLTGTVINVGSVADANGLDVNYGLPGTAYLSEINRLHVLESKPTVTLSASSPSGSRTVSSSDNAFVFTISADSQEKIQIRTAKELTECLIGFTDTVAIESAVDTTAAEQVDGSGCNADDFGANDDFVAYLAPLLETYAYASFWIRFVDSVGVDDVSLLPTEIELGVNADNASTLDHVTAVTAANIVGSPSTMVEGSWYHVYDVAIPAAAIASDEYIGIQFPNAVAAGPDNANDDIFLDRVVLYNDKISVDIASDADFDGDYDADTNHEDQYPTVAYLKEGGTTVATGYVDYDSNGANFIVDQSLAHVDFYPISGTNAAIEISKGTSKTFTVQLNSSELLDEDAGSDDPVTFSIDLGSSSDGTVTAGDLWWNETNFADQANGGGGTAYSLINGDTGVIRWVGQVSNTTLYGNTLKY